MILPRSSAIPFSISAMDVNQDGWMDLIRVSLPGEEIVWYENPGPRPGHWRMHPILAHAGNESPVLVDVDGDGRPDILCNDWVAKEMIWMKSPSAKGGYELDPPCHCAGRDRHGTIHAWIGFF
jgi:hypothetical protein